ncbi:4-hydroxyphenylpyruvate dioxygenase [Glycomyces sambucus]|uniref:3-dehydroshikimate dehydratase n=1 Tax=Glycomyces sambucus TaxID=380244 RepID=A0A1G9F389_9ACTN|nr:sugar phosphate isomerase/epimerase and 4-hydroxyphenylpyruvate domain-containing protein [Glycomyces sambucus]SDK82831.1 4-hydroxyphenylpyruvate dioxygenase [Glycomyces sambucus]
MHTLGIATVCLSGTLDDKLTAAAAAGFDGVEVFEPDLVAAADGPEEVRARCADLGLSIDLYQPFRDFEAVPPGLLRANLRRAEAKFAVMERLGADLMLVCSSVHPDAVDDDDLAAEHLHLLAERAAGHGVRLAYEALAWGRHVATYDRAWRIVRRADHPNLGLCLDSFHILSRGSDPAAIRVIPPEKLFFLQLADAPHLDMDVLQWSRHHRLFPGQGAFDLPGFLRTVLGTGYTGPLSLEVFNDVFRQSDPRVAAVDALRSLLGLQEAAGHTALPAPPRLDGTAFVEIGAGPGADAEVTGALEALGFTRGGEHRSKPVSLWEQGSARVLVNRAAAAEGATAVAAIAVESTDPPASARRAERLLAPVLPREHRAGEADLAAVAAPGGTSVFFCRTDAAEGWRADFAPTGEVPDPGAGLTAVDHVALTQQTDDFDGAALFYRTVFGLHPEKAAEVAAPFGLMRSLSMTDAERRVRIALSVAAVRRGGWAPGVPHPQHVAFATADAATAAARLRGAGLLLEIPGNYYDDLDARLDLPPDRLALMRERSLLYDRDEHGELLHCYTPVLGSRVFFEAVQRIGGYTGYGAPNAPVRMAAHRRERLARSRAARPHWSPPTPTQR